MRVHSCEIMMQQICRLHRLTPPLVEEETSQTHERSLNEHKLGHGSQRASKPRTTMLAKASRNLLGWTVSRGVEIYMF
jgi:hypothetical protein